MYAAHLRVYLPARATSHWRVHIPPPAGTRRTVTLSDLGLWHGSMSEDAFSAEWDGRTWLCPRFPRLRMLEAVLAVRAGHVSSVADVLVPEPVAEAASAELAALRRRVPRARSFILSSPWHVPLRWFALVSPDERDEYRDAEGYPSIRHRTSMADARARMRRAAEIIGGAGFTSPIVEAVESLAGWLSGFADDAMVELDYGTVAHLFDPADLAGDDSVRQVAASLEALSRGDFESAEYHYMAVAARWALAQALMISS